MKTVVLTENQLNQIIGEAIDGQLNEWGFSNIKNGARNMYNKVNNWLGNNKNNTANNSQELESDSNQTDNYWEPEIGPHDNLHIAPQVIYGNNEDSETPEGGNYETPEESNSENFETPEQNEPQYRRIAAQSKFNGYKLDDNGNYVLDKDKNRISNYETEYYTEENEREFVNTFVPAYNAVCQALNSVQNLPQIDSLDLADKLTYGLRAVVRRDKMQGINNSMKNANDGIMTITNTLQNLKANMKNALQFLGVETKEDYQHYNMQEQKLRRLISKSISKALNEHKKG